MMTGFQRKEIELSEVNILVRLDVSPPFEPRSLLLTIGNQGAWCCKLQNICPKAPPGQSAIASQIGMKRSWFEVQSTIENQHGFGGAHIFTQTVQNSSGDCSYQPLSFNTSSASYFRTLLKVNRKHRFLPSSWKWQTSVGNNSQIKS